MSTLALSLPAQALTAATELHYVLSSDGRQVTRSGRCSAPLLPQPGRTGETVAVVPPRQLSWQRVTLPQGALAQRQRLRAVLEGLLEEQLLDDPAQLHFALPPEAVAGVPLWVAVCDRAWLQGALHALEAAGHRVDRIVPAHAPGPTASGRPECTVIGTPEEASAVLAGMGPEQAVTLLPLPAPGLTALLPPSASVRAEPAVAALAERLFGQAVPLLSQDEALLAAVSGPWDLAQFDLVNNGRQRALRWLGTGINALWRAPEWRAARWALGLLALLQVAALNLWAWQDARVLASQQAAARAVLQQAFPQVKLVVDAPVQMRKEVALLRQQTGALDERDLEPLLAAAASVLPADQIPTRIDYAEGALRLSGLTLTEAQRTALAPPLAARGLRASQQDGALVLQPAGATP